MSKSILVMDTPECCCGCDLESGHYCGKEKRYITKEEFEIIPDWCPLMAFPEKKVMDFREECNMYISRYWEGYNACIDEILKGVNENG